MILLVFCLLYLRRFLRNLSVVRKIRSCQQGQVLFIQLHHYDRHRVYNTLTKCCHDSYTGRRIASSPKSDIETLLDMYMDWKSRLTTHAVLVQSRQAFDMWLVMIELDGLCNQICWVLLRCHERLMRKFLDNEGLIEEIRDGTNSNSNEYHQRKNPFSPFSRTKSKLRIQILQFPNGCFLRF